MQDTATLNAVIARNLAFWRQAHGYTLEGTFFAGTGVRSATLAAYERGEKPALAAHLLQLASLFGVPVTLLAWDMGEGFYQTAARGERWYDIWCSLMDMEEEGQFAEITRTLEGLREKVAIAA